MIAIIAIIAITVSVSCWPKSQERALDSSSASGISGQPKTHGADEALRNTIEVCDSSLRAIQHTPPERKQTRELYASLRAKRYLLSSSVEYAWYVLIFLGRPGLAGVSVESDGVGGGVSVKPLVRLMRAVVLTGGELSGRPSPEKHASRRDQDTCFEVLMVWCRCASPKRCST